MDSHGGDKKTLRKVKQRIQKRRQKRSKQKLQRRTKRKQRITKRKINKKGGGANKPTINVEIFINSDNEKPAFLNNETYTIHINIDKIYETDIFDKLVRYKFTFLHSHDGAVILFKNMNSPSSGEMSESRPYYHITGIIELVNKMGFEELKHIVPPLK